MYQWQALGILILANSVLATSLGDPSAEKAVLRNGKQIAGKLQVDARGNWSFHPLMGKKPLPLPEIWQVRLTESPPQPAGKEPVFHARFSAGQQVTGRFKSLDAKTCTLYTAWTGEVVLPCSALLSLWYDDPAAPPTGPNRHPHHQDPGQDELWLAAGDQLLGKVLQVDSGHVEFQARFGKRRYAWGEVQGIFFQEQKASAQSFPGPTVRLWLWSGQGRSQDSIVSRLHGLDEKQLTIQHSLVGERKIDRKYVSRLSWVLDD